MELNNFDFQAELFLEIGLIIANFSIIQLLAFNKAISFTILGRISPALP